MRRVLKSLLAAAIWLGALGASLALDAREAQAVIAIMERLAEETGDGMYYDAAADFYAFDAENEGLIAQAGFSAESWQRAYEAVASGYIAAIPESSFAAAFEEPLARLEASTSLSAEQKAAIRADFEEQMVQLRAVRMAGQPHVGVVSPFMAQLERFFPTGF